MKYFLADETLEYTRVRSEKLKNQTTVRQQRRTSVPLLAGQAGAGARSPSEGRFGSAHQSASIAPGSDLLRETPPLPSRPPHAPLPPPACGPPCAAGPRSVTPGGSGGASHGQRGQAPLGTVPHGPRGGRSRGESGAERAGAGAEGSNGTLRAPHGPRAGAGPAPARLNGRHRPATPPRPGEGPGRPGGSWCRCSHVGLGRPRRLPAPLPSFLPPALQRGPAGLTGRLGSR